MKTTQDKKDTDINGYITYYDVPMTKVGVFPYLGKTISPELEPDKVYQVLRPEEELTSPETLKSLEAIPFVIDHTMIGEGFTPPEDKGIEGTTLKNVKVKGDLITNDLTAYTDRCKQAIDGGKRDLSMGYRCTYDLTPGEYKGQHYDAIQRNIRFNHIALVDEGRMGSECRVTDNAIVYDSLDEWITVHPNGKEHKGRPLFVEEGESKEQAINRKFAKKEQSKNDFSKYDEKIKNSSEEELKKWVQKLENPKKFKYYLDDAESEKWKNIAQYIREKSGLKIKSYIPQEKKITYTPAATLSSTINFIKEKNIKKITPQSNLFFKIKNSEIYKNSKFDPSENSFVSKSDGLFFTFKNDNIYIDKDYTSDNNDLQNKENTKMAKITLDEDLKQEIKEEIKKELLNEGAEEVIEEKEEDEIIDEAPEEEAPTVDGDEDKRKLIDEIGGILKGKVDDELIRTIMKKAEELAYNPSETGSNDGNGGKTTDEEPAPTVEPKKEDKKEEGLSMDDAIKYIAKRDELVAKIRPVIGNNAKYSSMNIDEVVKYACDKLDIPNSKEHLEGYLAGLNKSVKASVKVSMDSFNASSDFVNTYKSKN